jgi:DNA-binding SARP family transcriptional activator
MHPEMLHLLGQPHHNGGSIPLERTTLLVTMLACAGDWQNRESLMALLWADAPPELAQTRLRQLVYRTGGFACFAGLEAQRKRLRFVAPTDVGLFRRAIQDKHWLKATQAYGGRLLEGYIPPDEPELQNWLNQQRNQLEQDYIDAVLQASQELSNEQGFGLLQSATKTCHSRNGCCTNCSNLGR